MGMNMLLPQAGKQHAPMQVAPGNAIVDPNTGGIIYQAPPSKQESNKVITLAPGAKAYDYDGREIASNDGKEDEVGVVAIDPTDGKRHFFSRSYAIEKRLEAPEPSPGVTVNTGDITPAVKTDIQTKIAQSRVSERQLGRISTTWNPDWNYGEVQVWEAIKGGISKSKFADKTIGKFIPEESWDDYSKYIAWSRDVISMSNTHIHNMTGAQLSPGEVTRLLSELATRSDNARAYKAKLDATMAFLSDTREEYERMLLAGTPIEVVESTMADIIRNGISQIAGIPAEEELPPGVRPMP